MGFTYYLRVVSGLCFVLALILVVGYLARRIGRKTPFLAGAELGVVLGRVHLARGATLHFVQTGGRVLVVGATNTSMSLVAEFDASAFDGRPDTSHSAPQEFSPDNFLAQLRQSSRTLAENPQEDIEDDGIASLRGDIQRLQQYLKEESRDPRE